MIARSVGGLIYGRIGGLIGSLATDDIWEPVELPAKHIITAQPSVAVHPTGRFSVGASIPVRR